nr:MAG TPA: hypothetical protein [Caudoviricetes sp.]
MVSHLYARGMSRCHHNRLGCPYHRTSSRHPGHGSHSLR